MTSFDLSGSLEALKGKVCVLTGGSRGIGESTVRVFHNAGALVIFGDVNAQGGSELEASLGSSVHFLKTDILVYAEVVALFQLTVDTYGRVDHAISNAAIIERGEWFSPDLSIASIQTPPDTKTLDVNLTGTLYFARIAMPYLRHNAQKEEDKSLVLIASVAGFKESPGLFVYQSAKHGVIGLMRSLRLYALPELGVRVNCVCPWATRTGMTASFAKAWDEEGLPMNEPEHIADVVAAISKDRGLNGESVYVEGGRGWMIEKNLDRLESQWLGKEPSDSLVKGQDFLGRGAKWSKET